MVLYVALGLLLGAGLIRLGRAATVFDSLIESETAIAPDNKEMAVLVGCVCFWPFVALCLAVDFLREYL